LDDLLFECDDALLKLVDVGGCAERRGRLDVVLLDSDAGGL
jgi:hypothetical protein